MLHQDVGELQELVRARKQSRLPVVLSRDEVRAALGELERDDRRSWLIVSLLFGSGLRLSECLRLRVLDIDLGPGELTVGSGKGDKNRATTLPQALVPDLREQQRERSAGMVPAVGVPSVAPLGPSTDGPRGTPPRPPDRRPTRRPRCSPARRSRRAQSSGCALRRLEGVRQIHGPLGLVVGEGRLPSRVCGALQIDGAGATVSAEHNRCRRTS